MRYTMAVCLCIFALSVLQAAVPAPPPWSTGTVTTVNINGTPRYQCEAQWNGVSFFFWYIDIADAGTDGGKVDLGTRVQYSLRSNIPELGAEPRDTKGQKNGGWDGDYAYEFHPEGQDIWRSEYGWHVFELNYRRPRPLYLLTDGVESMIGGVRPWEFHLEALPYFMGETPRDDLDAEVPDYASHPDAGPISGITLKPMTVTLSKSYWMMEKEITQEQWNAMVGTKPANWPVAPAAEGYASYVWNAASQDPVTFVTTQDVEDFIAQVNAQGGVAGNAELPTEAEWEYACRIPDRNVPSSNTMASERGMSQQDLPFAYGMHLYDPMKFYFMQTPPIAAGVGKRIGFNRPAPADSFHAIFDFRYTFSYNLPNFQPGTPDPDDIDGTAHYIRGYANHEGNHPLNPGDLSGGKIVAGSSQNHWGLYHMHGNVSEMVRDVWDGASPHHQSLSSTGLTDYFVDMSSEPAWKMKFHPCKGGSWMSGVSQCRAAARGQLLKYDLTNYPCINADGSVDGTRPDPRCFSDTVGARIIIYEAP